MVNFKHYIMTLEILTRIFFCILLMPDLILFLTFLRVSMPKIQTKLSDNGRTMSFSKEKAF